MGTAAVDIGPPTDVHDANRTLRRYRGSRVLAAALVLAAAIGAAVVGLALLGESSPQSLPPGVGTFGGYQIPLDTRSVGAVWTVPRIVSMSKEARAATWIGAQGPSRAFIQAGTEEDVDLSRSHNAIPFYYAWWTDTVSDDIGHRLFDVQPGDRMTVTLTHRGASWLVAIRDITSGRNAVFSTTQEGRARFDLAEWVQENPPVRGGKHLAWHHSAYPHLTAVRFEQLLVNGVPPAGNRVLSEWLSTGHGLLAPTPVTDDAFSLRPATITAEGRQYLHMNEPLQATAEQLRSVELHWYGRPAGWPRIRAAARTNAVIAERTMAGLRAAQWSPAVRPVMAALVRIDDAAARVLVSLPSVEPPSQGRVATAWRHEAEAEFNAVHAVRRVLGLPDPPY